MSDSIQTQANKYKIASEKVLSKMPSWKRLALEDHRKNKVKDSRFLDDYYKEVCELAEKEELSLSA